MEAGPCYIVAVKNSRQLRDLTWAINSQSLLTDQPDAELDPRQVDQNHLSAFLSNGGGHRVGRYFERLVLYWLTHVRQVEVIANSLQIREGQRTIGEIDLLFRDEQGRMTHWEIAVKFYLHLASETLLESHYIGPNAGDTFERKMERLFDHQLPRSVKRFPDVEIRQAFVKGRIFYHPSENPPATLPCRLASDHTRCKWVRSSETRLLDQDDSVRYKTLGKPFWLAPEALFTDELHEASSTGLLSPAEQIDHLARHFAHCDRPVLIARLEVFDHGYQESDRFFVVSDRWPAAT